MPTTINIKNPPYNAPGDGQIVQTNVTLSSQSLTTTGSIFASSDVGKILAVGNSPGDVSGTGFIYTTTISCFVSGTAVGLTDPAPSSINNLSKYVTWGNNDSPAFTLFNSCNQGSTGLTLQIPAGIFIMGPNGANISAGIPDLLVSGAGSSVTTLAFNGAVFGSKGVSEVASRPQGTATLLSNVSSGASTLFLAPVSTAIDTFSSGSIAVIAGIDLQGFGEPINPGIFEFITLTSVSTVTGQINFTPSLRNSYQTNWPTYNEGSSVNPFPAPNLGGPGSLYSYGFAIGPDWFPDPTPFDNTFTYEGFSLASGDQQVNTAGGIMIFSSINQISGTLFPTDAKTWTARYCTIEAFQIEVDKVTQTANFDHCSLHQLLVQSGSVTDINISNCTFTGGLNGTAKNTYVTNTTISGGTGFAPTANGCCASLTMDNTTFQIFQPSQARQSAFLSTASTTSSGVRFTSSTVYIPHSYGVPTWTVPGFYCYYNRILRYDGVFKLTDMSFASSAVNLDVIAQVENSFGVSPQTPLSTSATFTMGAFPCPNMTITNCDTVTWASSTTYDLNSQVKGSDGHYYNSQTSSNIGIDPTTGSSLWYLFSPSYLNVPTEIKSLCQPQAQGKPYGSYGKRSFTGTFVYNGGGPVSPFVWSTVAIGRLVACNINVITPFTGAGTPFYNPWGPFGFAGALDPTQTTQISTNSIQIDLRTAGVRTITPSCAVAASIDDVLPLTGTGNIWFGDYWGGYVSTPFSSQSSATWAVWEVEMITDSGITQSSTPITLDSGISISAQYGIHRSHPTKIPHH